MADAKKTTEKAAVAGGLAQAGASGDPSVHAVLAEIESARSNGDDEALKAAEKKLADLGYQ